MPLKITFGTFKTFQNCADICASHGTPPVSTKPMLNLPLVQVVLFTDNGINARFLNPILHTSWLNNHALTLKRNTAKYYFGEKSSFLHTFLKIFCESWKIEVKLKDFLISML
jgi:hypothetical protein